LDFGYDPNHDPGPLQEFFNGILPVWDRAVMSCLGGGLRYSVVVVVTNRPNFDTTTFSLSFNASAVNSVREMAAFAVFYVWGVTLGRAYS